MTLWLVLPASLPAPDDNQRKIKGGPLIDLPGLQQAIRSGAVTDEAVEVVNRSCDDSLDTLTWTYQDILDCLLCATVRDFKGSEWCDTSWAGSLACDAYSIPYDDSAKCRAPQSSVKYYLKFSLDEGESLRIQMVRAHLS